MVDYSRRTFGSGAIGALAAMSSTSPEARPLTELRPTSSGEAQPTGASPADPFASGLKPEDDFALTGPVPGVPQMIETFNLWLYDGARDICYNTSPHLHEGTCRALATVFLPGGRILRRHNGDDDRFDNPRRFGSRYVQYECVEPYRRWIYRLKDVPMIETSDAEVAAGGMTSDQPSRRVSAEIHLKTLSPAWIMGSLLPECAKLNRIQAGFWMGSRLPSGPSPLTRRYEQLAQGEGVITVDGEEFAFKGSGMRAHVRGVRDTHGMPGHYWASAVFPSGKGFAVVGYQQPDGTTLYHEGYVWQDRKVYPVRNVWVPPMDRLPRSAPYTLSLHSEALGSIRIDGQDMHAFVWSTQGWAGGGSDQMKPVYGLDPNAPLVLKQAPARYEWDGETGFGMRETSGGLPT